MGMSDAGVAIQAARIFTGAAPAPLPGAATASASPSKIAKRNPVRINVLPRFVFFYGDATPKPRRRPRWGFPARRPVF